jgi:hypothetical protein
LDNGADVHAQGLFLWSVIQQKKIKSR